LALVVQGSVSVMPAIADCIAALAAVGDAIFTVGTLHQTFALGLVAREDGTKLAVWSDDDMVGVLAESPSVAHEFRKHADRLRARAGAAMGLLGDRLDDATRNVVMERLDVRSYASGEVIIEAGALFSACTSWAPGTWSSKIPVAAAACGND
jgi:hypothetical protein